MNTNDGSGTEELEEGTTTSDTSGNVNLPSAGDADHPQGPETTTPQEQPFTGENGSVDPQADKNTIPQNPSVEGDKVGENKSSIDEADETKEKAEPNPVIGDDGSAQSPTTTINNILINQANFIGQNREGVQGEKARTDVNKLPLSRLEETTWRKVREVFVKPPTYDDKIETLLKKVLESRIIIVRGKVHSGRFSCVLFLGIKLFESQKIQEQQQFYEYRRAEHHTASLIDFAQHDDVQKREKRSPLIYILQEALHKGVSAEDFATESIQSLSTSLKEAEAYLFVTTTDEALVGSEVLVFDVKEFTPGLLDEAFEKHLNAYDSEQALVPIGYIDYPIRNALQKVKPELLKSLTSPVQINDLMGRISQMRLDTVEASSSSVADEPATAQGFKFTDAAHAEVLQAARLASEADSIPSRLWFEGLSPNARLYALMVYLFESMETTALNELYADVVNHLRRSGVANLRNPYQLGFNDLVFLLQAKVESGDHIEFSHSALQREIRSQVRNYRYLLWEVVPLLLVFIERFQQPEYWEIREKIGIALGRLGVFNLSKFKGELNKLALHSQGGVVVTAGYALQELVRQGTDYYEYVEQCLQTWAESKNFDLKWAFAACLWRVFIPLTEQVDDPSDRNYQLRAEETWKTLQAQLLKFVERIEDFKVSSFTVTEKTTEGQRERKATPQEYLYVHAEQLGQLISAVTVAVQRMAEVHPKRTVSFVEEWLRNGSDSTKIIGVLAVVHLFGEYEDSPTRLRVDRYQPFLELVMHLITAVHTISATVPNATELIVRIIQILGKWIEGRGLEDKRQEQLAEAVQQALLRTVNRAGTPERQLLRSALSPHWTEHSHLKVRALGYALIARSMVLDGVPTGLPGGKYGLIMMDASEPATRGRYNAMQLAQYLYERFSPRVDLALFRMGQATCIISRDKFQSLRTSDLKPEYFLPRLIAPALEGIVLWEKLESNKDEKEVTPEKEVTSEKEITVNKPIDPNDLYFLALLTWGEIEDGADLWRATNDNDLSLMSREERIEARMRLFNAPVTATTAPVVQSPWIPPMVAVRAHAEASFPDGSTVVDFPPMLGTGLGSAFLELEQQLDLRIARTLVSVPADEWEQLLAPYWKSRDATFLTSVGATTPMIVARLDKWVGALDDITRAKHPGDVTRTMACTVLWLASRDLHECVALLKRWVAPDIDQPLHRAMGEACAKLLFTIYGHQRALTSIQIQTLFMLLPDMARMIEKNDGTGIHLVMQAIRRWMRTTEGLAWFQGKVTEVSAPVAPIAIEAEPSGAVETPAPPLPTPYEAFSAMLRQGVSAKQSRFLLAQVEAWKKPLRAEGESETPEDLITLADELRLRILEMMGPSMEALQSGQKYGLFILDSKPSPRSLWQNYRKEADQLLKTLSKKGDTVAEATRPLVFRLGQSLPVAGGGDSISNNPLLTVDTFAPAPLVGPILDLFRPEDVHFIILFTTRPTVDQDDWFQEWQAKILWCDGKSSGGHLSGSSEGGRRLRRVAMKDLTQNITELVGVSAST